MLSYDDLQAQTMGLRKAYHRLCSAMRKKGDTIPEGWNNNAMWHLGHLIVTPHLLTYGLFKEPLGINELWKPLFCKGSSPENWESANCPEYAELLDLLLPGTEELFAAMKDRQDEKFPEPYPTSAGPVLHTPAEALNFSMAHDGIHLGLTLAIRRCLDKS